jgi:hypothetical protein
MVVGQLDANDAREFVRRRIALLNVRPQLVVTLVLAPVLRAQHVKDISGAPVSAALGTPTVVIKF